MHPKITLLVILNAICTVFGAAILDDFEYKRNAGNNSEENWNSSEEFPIDRVNRPMEDGFTYYNVGVLMASHLYSPFDLERCGPAVDMAIEEINEKFLAAHKIRLQKVQAR